LPVLVERAGGAARFAWDEFFFAEHHNPHTQKAYMAAVRRFLSWCEGQGVELLGVTPGMVGQYLVGLGGSAAKRNLHLSALRGFFDRLVNRHVVILNPAASVRGVKKQVIEGKTPEITVRHDLEGNIRAYLDAAGIAAKPKDRPLFRSTRRRTKQLTANPLTTKAICELVKRRLKDAGLPSRLSPHSFRVATITDLLTQGVPHREPPGFTTGGKRR
jgi:site-specific recombinase XerD